MSRRRKMIKGKGARFTVTGWLRSQATPFWLTVGVIFLLTGVAFSYGASFVSKQEALLTPDPPARVDGQDVSEQDVSNRITRFRDQWRSLQRPRPRPNGVHAGQRLGAGRGSVGDVERGPPARVCPHARRD